MPSGCICICDGPLPVLAVDCATGLPRFWATVWLASLSARSPARNTLLKRVPYIAHFYDYCDGRWGRGCVDDAVGANDAVAFQDQLSAYLSMLTMIPEDIDSGTVGAWDAVRAFGIACAVDRSTRDDKWLAVQMYLRAQPRVSRPLANDFRFPRALPSKTLEELLQVCSPVSQDNPVDDLACRWRNWLAVTLLLLGLRRGEVLLLLVDSLHSDVDEDTGEIVYWLNVRSLPEELDDARFSRPSIKTANSLRQVPVPEDVARSWEHYVQEYRTSDASPFLMLSLRGRPLSAESVDKFLARATERLSPKALELFQGRTGGKRRISSHDLRHTSACDAYAKFMARNGDQELAFQNMRALFGWDRKSDMPNVYAAAAIKDQLGETMREIARHNLEAIRAMGSRFPGQPS